MKKIIRLVLLISTVFYGCTTRTGISSSPTPWNTSITTPAYMPTMIQGMTIPTSATQTYLGICSSSADMRGTNVEGKIVFYNPDKGLVFYDVASGKEYMIPNTKDIFALHVAPDRKRVANFDWRSETGWVISTNGDRIELQIKDKFDGYFYGWLDNHKLIFVDRSHSDGSIITFDVDTGNINKTVTDLQDVYNLDPTRWYVGGDWPTVIFDSELSHMVYLSGELPGEVLGKLGFIVRETETHKLLWSKVSSDVGVQPKWSPDGEFVAVVITKDDEVGDQIYIIDRGGVEARVLNTNTIGINVVEWSPDGKRLSYGSTNVLAIYDFTSNQLQEFQSPDEIWSIIWSPAGNQIAVKGFLVNLLIDCALPLKLKSNDLRGPFAWLIEKP